MVINDDVRRELQAAVAEAVRALLAEDEEARALVEKARAAGPEEVPVEDA